MSKGWECPVCHKGMGPDTQECLNCKRNEFCFHCGGSGLSGNYGSTSGYQCIHCLGAGKTVTRVFTSPFTEDLRWK